MLFNSYGFLFLFLPVCLAGYYVLGLSSRRTALAFLMLASMVFYGAWNIAYLPLLAASILFNYVIGRRLSAPDRDVVARKRVLVFGIGVNLALLGYYKYLGFLSRSVLDAMGVSVPDGAVPAELPLGISFYTFTQIAFLVDTFRRDASEPRPVHYGLFVTFFPHLIAGPILHHKEMMPQFERAEAYRPDVNSIARGLWFFTLGLVKKVLIADGIAKYVHPVFSDPTTVPTLVEAWVAALAYTFQLYFDFSGYSDMAVGLALLFGISLPLNFNSPYKAASIIDFWKRWHMTLSRFLRDYLYFPLGGNRKGSGRRYLNLMLVMALGGLWHGAGWTYVAWGTLHGLYLVVNHGFRALVPPSWTPSLPLRMLFVLMTFLAVVIAWVFFRAESLHHAHAIIGGMFGANGVVLAPNHLAHLRELGPLLLGAGVQAGELSLVPGLREFVGWLAICFIIIWFVPNTQEWSRLLWNLRDATLGRAIQMGLFGAALGAVFAIAVFFVTKGSEFLYFQF